VGEGGARVGEGEACEQAGAGEPGAQRLVAQVAGQQRQRLDHLACGDLGQRARDRIGVHVPDAFQRMAQRIEAGAHRDGAGQAHGQQRIDQRDRWIERLARQRIFLQRPGVPDGRPGGDLAAGARRGGDGDDRRAAELAAVGAVHEVAAHGLEVAVGGRQHLGGVHHRAAPQGHDRLDRPCGVGVGAAGLREADEVGIGADVAHNDGRLAGHREGAPRQVGEHAAAVGVVIGDEAPGAALQHLAQRLEDAGAELHVDRIAVAPHPRSLPRFARSW
jgi:hypothetical protein